MTRPPPGAKPWQKFATSGSHAFEMAMNRAANPSAAETLSEPAQISMAAAAAEDSPDSIKYILVNGDLGSNEQMGLLFRRMDCE